MTYHLAILGTLWVAIPVHAQDGVPPLHREARATLSVVRGPRAENESVTGVMDEFVRRREMYMRYCYIEMGLKRDSTLTGFIAVTVHMGNIGQVDSIGIRPLRSRSWRGAAADSVVSCVRTKMHQWQWPSTAKKGTHVFDVGFLRDTGFVTPPDWLKESPSKRRGFAFP